MPTGLAWPRYGRVADFCGHITKLHTAKKKKRINLMAVSNHHTLHVTFGDLIALLRIRFFWDMKRCRWMLRNFIRNVAKHSSNDTASHPRRSESSAVSMCICTSTSLCHCLRLISEGYVCVRLFIQLRQRISFSIFFWHPQLMLHLQTRPEEYHQFSSVQWRFLVESVFYRGLCVAYLFLFCNTTKKGQVAGACEYGNELSGSIKCGKFLD